MLFVSSLVYACNKVSICNELYILWTILWISYLYLFVLLIVFCESNYWYLIPILFADLNLTRVVNMKCMRLAVNANCMRLQRTEKQIGNENLFDSIHETVKLGTEAINPFAHKSSFHPNSLHSKTNWVKIKICRCRIHISTSSTEELSSYWSAVNAANASTSTRTTLNNCVLSSRGDHKR